MSITVGSYRKRCHLSCKSVCLASRLKLAGVNVAEPSCTVLLHSAPYFKSWCSRQFHHLVFIFGWIQHFSNLDIDCHLGSGYTFIVWLVIVVALLASPVGKLGPETGPQQDGGFSAISWFARVNFLEPTRWSKIVFHWHSQSNSNWSQHYHSHFSFPFRFFFLLELNRISEYINNISYLDFRLIIIFVQELRNLSFFFRETKCLVAEPIYLILKIALKLLRNRASREPVHQYFKTVVTEISMVFFLKICFLPTLKTIAVTRYGHFGISSQISPTDELLK